MKKIVIALFASLFVLGAHAQDDAMIPLNYANTPQEEVYKYEGNVMRCYQWLQDTPLDKMQFERKIVTEFAFGWVLITPSIYIELVTNAVEFLNDADENMTSIYLCGYANYLLDKKKAEGILNTPTVIGTTREEVINATEYAIDACLQFYEKNRESYQRIPGLESFKKMKKKGTFEEYISSQVPENFQPRN